MGDAFGVCRLESLGHLNGGREGLGELEGAFGDPLAQRPAFEEGHDDEGASIDLVDFVDRADVGVVELGGSFGFALEALAAFLIAKQMWR